MHTGSGCNVQAEQCAQSRLLCPSDEGLAAKGKLLVSVRASHNKQGMLHACGVMVAMCMRHNVNKAAGFAGIPSVRASHTYKVAACLWHGCAVQAKHVASIAGGLAHPRGRAGSHARQPLSSMGEQACT
jgi:hypothetical protein